MYSYRYTWWPTVCSAEECYNNNNITRSAPSSRSYESANMSGTVSWGMLQQQQHNSHFFNVSFSWGIATTTTTRYRQQFPLQDILGDPVWGMNRWLFQLQHIWVKHSLQTYLVTHSVFSWGMLQQQQHNSLQHIDPHSPPTPPPPEERPQPLGQTQHLLPYCTFPIRGFPSELFMKIPSFIPKS